MKAILILGMPSSCDECPLFDLFYRDMICRANGCGIDYPYPENFRQEWCPLKPVPQKKEEKQYRGNGVFGINTAMETRFNQGYNACIDEILGDKE